MFYPEGPAGSDDPLLAKCHKALGVDGAAVVRAMLIEGMTAKQVAEARGIKGQQWPLYTPGAISRRSVFDKIANLVPGKRI